MVKCHEIPRVLQAWDVLPKLAKKKVMTLGDPGCGHPAKFRNKARARPVVASGTCQVATLR